MNPRVLVTDHSLDRADLLPTWKRAPPPASAIC
jgi:hypothetical protein